MTLLTSSDFRAVMGAFEESFKTVNSVEKQLRDEFVIREFRVYDKIPSNTISFYVGKLYDKCYPGI